MNFSPQNTIVRLCIEGMGCEDQGKTVEAGALFLQAWEQASDDFERFLAAWFVARTQHAVADQARWYGKVLSLASGIGAEAVRSAFPALHDRLSACYEKLGDLAMAAKHRELAGATLDQPVDPGPFYHGTRAQLVAGDLLTAGRRSNYKAEVIMNHTYFTASPDNAGLAAALAQGVNPERVYLVEPTGSFEDDPNVTNLKFPGNPTRSYRSRDALRVIAQVLEWQRMSPEALEQMRARIAANQGEILN